VPAVAVKRGEQVLFIITGRKGRVGGISSVVTIRKGVGLSYRILEFIG
jgi:hypothetical protein